MKRVFALLLMLPTIDSPVINSPIFNGNNRNYRYYQFLCHSRSGPRIVYRQPEWRGIPI
jgi:hypothetical protein